MLPLLPPAVVLPALGLSMLGVGPKIGPRDPMTGRVQGVNLLGLVGTYGMLAPHLNSLLAPSAAIKLSPMTGALPTLEQKISDFFTAKLAPQINALNRFANFGIFGGL